MEEIKKICWICDIFHNLCQYFVDFVMLNILPYVGRIGCVITWRPCYVWPWPDSIYWKTQINIYYQHNVILIQHTVAVPNMGCVLYNLVWFIERTAKLEFGWLHDTLSNRVSNPSPLDMSMVYSVQVLDVNTPKYYNLPPNLTGTIKKAVCENQRCGLQLLEVHNGCTSRICVRPIHF